jgi:putative nucleotidyltransferase with HDIG domain
MWTFLHVFGFIPLGAIIALVYTAYGSWTLLLFLVPIFLARYTFKLYVEMKEAHINTVAALTSAIDASDPYTHGHSYRVSRYALRVGRALGLNTRDIEILEYGALLHDIGKIAIRHEILLKKERLSDQEFLTLKQHPTIGADIVENLKFLREAAVLVRYHHEQPNGRGYPEGLKDDAIPMGARIILVCDAFDAMTSDRPYRKGIWSNVLEQFEKHKGVQFDASQPRDRPGATRRIRTHRRKRPDHGHLRIAARKTVKDLRCVTGIPASTSTRPTKSRAPSRASPERRGAPVLSRSGTSAVCSRCRRTIATPCW